MKSAYVIESGRQEKIVCEKCANQSLVIHDGESSTFVLPPEGVVTYGDLINFTPVTLSCEAKCSKCGAKI